MTVNIDMNVANSIIVGLAGRYKVGVNNWIDCGKVIFDVTLVRTDGKSDTIHISTCMDELKGGVDIGVEDVFGSDVYYNSIVLTKTDMLMYHGIECCITYIDKLFTRRLRDLE